MSALPPIPGGVAQYTAPQLFGHLFNYGLFGMLVTQVYIYYLSFPHDNKYIKAYVYGLFVVECLQIALTTHDAYKILGAGWGDPLELQSIQLLWLDLPVLGGIISSSVQCFYAWRIYLLSKSAILALFVSTVAIMQGSSAMAVGIMVHVLKVPGAEVQERTTTPTTIWLGGSFACDVIIAVCMLYYLSRGKQGLATDAMLSRLMRLSIETGAATASIACIELILFLVYKHNNAHLGPALVLSKLYSNSLMMTFNNRTQLRSLRGAVQTTSGLSGSGSGAGTGGARIWISAHSQVETTIDPPPVLRGAPGGAQAYDLKDLSSADRYHASDYMQKTAIHDV